MCCRVRRSAPVRTTYSRCASTGQLLLGTGAPEPMTVVGVHTQERTARQTVAIGLRFAESRRIIPSDSAIKTQNGNVTPSPYAEKNAIVSMRCAESARTAVVRHFEAMHI